MGDDAAAGKQSQRQVDHDELLAMVKQTVPVEMERQHVAGAVVAVVHNCETAFSEGWGLADLATNAPMRPASTYFRIGSIAKVVTATVGMEMAERGRLDLGADIEQYLPKGYLQLAYDMPITMTDLFTHTAGLGERWSDLATRDEADVLPLERYLAEYPPIQVAQPRTVKVYNSTAFALAALVMERVSQKSFDQLSSDLLFGPAGMDRQTWVVNERQKRNVATGYRFRNGEFSQVPGDFYYHIAPGADGIATSMDMIRFLNVHLGCSGDDGVLSADSLLEMHRTHFTHHPAVPGMALGFEELQLNGQRWLKKPGGAPGITTFVAFLPGTGTGIFIGVNADQHPFWRSIMVPFGELFSAGGQQPTVDGKLRNLPASQYAGWYRALRFSPESYLRLMSVRQRHVVAVDNDSLRYGGRIYHAVGDDLFEEERTKNRLGFRIGEGDQPRFVFHNGSDGYEAVAWWETFPVQVFLAVLFTLLFLVGLIYTFLRMAQLHIKRLPINPLLWLSAGIVVLNAVVLTGWGIYFSTFSPWIAQVGAPFVIHVLLVLPFISLLAACASAWLMLRHRHLSQLASYDLVSTASITLAAMLFLPFLSYWNLLGVIG